MARHALRLSMFVLALACALAVKEGGRVKRQTVGGAGVLSALGSLAGQVMPGGILQQLQGVAGLFGQGTTPSPLYTQYPQYPQGGGGGYGQYYPAASPSGVREALETLVRSDTRRCVPRLVCEMAAGAVPFDALGALGDLNGFGAFRAHAHAPAHAAARQEVLMGADAVTGLLSLLAGSAGVGVGGGVGVGAGAAEGGALAVLGRAALLGAAARGRPHTCLSAYPACPREPARLLLYLNNHRGGVFRLFAGPPGRYDGCGYYRAPLRLHLPHASEALGRSLAATPSEALPAEHRAVRRVRRMALRFPRGDDVDEEGEDDGDNALDADPSRILHPAYSHNPVRFPSDGRLALQLEESSRTRMRFPREFNDSGSRIVGAGSGGARPPRDEIVAEGFDFDADADADAAFGAGGGGSQPAAPASGAGYIPEYVVTSGGKEYALAPGQTPEDFIAALRGEPRPPKSGSSAGSAFGTGGSSSEYRPFGSGGNQGNYQRPFGSNGDRDNYNGPFASNDDRDTYKRPFVSNDDHDNYNRPFVSNNDRDNYKRPFVSNGDRDNYNRPFVSNDNQLDYQRPTGSKINFIDDGGQQVSSIGSSSSYPNSQDSSSGFRDTRKGRGGFGGRLRFPRDGEESQHESPPAPARPLPAAGRPLPMVFPDRTGTGDLRLDNEHTFNRHPSTQDAQSSGFAFPGRYSA